MVQQANRVKECVVFRAYLPRRMALCFTFGLDVPAHLDQGNEAVEPGAVPETGADGEPGNTIAKLPGAFGPAHDRSELEPGTSQEQLGQSAFGTGTADRFVQEVVGLLIDYLHLVPVWVDLRRSSSSRSRAAMASRESSQRGDRTAIADHKVSALALSPAATAS